MILSRKALNLRKLTPILSRQFNHIHHNLYSRFIPCITHFHSSRISNNRMETYLDLKYSKRSKLNDPSQLSDQKLDYNTKVSYDSVSNATTTSEAYNYTPRDTLESDTSDFVLDLNDPKNKWVEEAMEVTHDAYEKQYSTYVSHVNAVVTYYKHKETGLTVVSFKTNDSKSEMSFDVSAPTYQFNDHGCTHVLEHSVLMRTKTYNKFNSFYHTVTGTYNSFLNALYFKNRTRFYFSSMDEKSFYHLVDNFMDSFFRPAFLEDKEVLEQEGWHYRVTKQDDKLTNTADTGYNVHGRNVNFSGVVYNEMKKRTYANPLDLAVSVLDHNLFSNTLRYDSGGHPDDLVDLTQKELSDYYHLYYGPKTATVYFHGPNDVYKRLQYVDEYMKKYNVGVKPDPKTGQLSHKADKQVLDKVSVHEEYKETPKYVTKQFGSVDNKDVLMMGWLLDPKYQGTNKYDLDVVDKLSFEVVKHLLLDAQDSVFKRALVDSKLGTRVVGPGFDDYYPSYPHMTFMFGVDGVSFTDKTRQENVKKFEQLVFASLKEVVEKGFKQEAVEAALNAVEFKHREQNYLMKEHRWGYYPKGLAFLKFVGPQYEPGSDPLEFMRFDDLVSQVRGRVLCQHSNYLSNLVKKHMLNNTTRVTLHLEAVDSVKYEKDMNQKVVKQLESRLSKLSKEEVDKMEDYYKKFKEYRQVTSDQTAFDTFPDVNPVVEKKESKDKTVVYKVTKDKVVQVVDMKEVESKDVNAFTVFVNPVESNKVLYMDYAVSVDQFTVEELKYLGVFAAMLKEAGTDTLTPEEVSYKVDKNLGGLSFSSFFSTVSNNRTYDDPEKGVGFLVVRAKALQDKTVHMVDVVNDLLKNANFANAKKGVEVVSRLVSQLKQYVVDNAHLSTMKKMASRFSVANYADEMVNGYSQMVFLRDVLVPLAEKDWNKVESVLNTMRNKLLKMRNLTVNLTGDSELVDSFVKDTSSWYNKMSSTFMSDASKVVENVWVKEVLDKKLMQSVEKNKLLVAPVRNNFVGVGGKLFDKNDKVEGDHSVVMQYLNRSFLFRYLRAAGGSYGVHVYLLNTGHVFMVSYADPNFLETLEVYKKVPVALEQAYDKVTDWSLKMHSLGVMGSMDKELHAEDKAYSVLTSRLRGESEDFKWKLKKEVMQTKREAFKVVADKFKSTDDWLNVCSLVSWTAAKTAPKDYKWFQ